MKTFIYKTQILEHHLDSFGHVNNAVYMELLEEARWDFITKNGYGLTKIKEEKKGPVILEANIKYKRELLNREFITIESKTARIEGKLMWVEQVIKKADDKVSAEASFMIGLMDMKERKLISPTKDWLDAVGVE